MKYLIRITNLWFKNETGFDFYLNSYTFGLNSKSNTEHDWDLIERDIDDDVRSDVNIDLYK